MSTSCILFCNHILQPHIFKLEAGYLFYNPVSIIEVDPANGHVLGGDAITIKGSGFIESSVVLIGGKAAISAEGVDDNTILAVTPAAIEPGLADVHVSNNIGVGALLDGFLYYASPKITSVVPPLGLVDGGNVVEVKGAGFTEPLAVTFGGKALENITKAVEVCHATSASITCP